MANFKPGTPKHGKWNQKRLWNGRAIRSARELQGLTQQELATATRIPQDMISRLECGRRSPRVDELVLIAGALGMPLVQLIAGGVREPAH